MVNTNVYRHCYGYCLLTDILVESFFKKLSNFNYVICAYSLLNDSAFSFRRLNSLKIKEKSALRMTGDNNF